VEGFPVHSRRGGCSCRGCSQERMVQDPRKAFGILWSIFFLPPILTYTFTFVDSRFILDPIIYKYCIICTPDSFFFTCQLVLIVVSSFSGGVSLFREGGVLRIYSCYRSFRTSATFHKYIQILCRLFTLLISPNKHPSFCVRVVS
jgi:hypothetical protein